MADGDETEETSASEVIEGAAEDLSALASAAVAELAQYANVVTGVDESLAAAENAAASAEAAADSAEAAAAAEANMTTQLREYVTEAVDGIAAEIAADIVAIDDETIVGAWE